MTRRALYIMAAAIALTGPLGCMEQPLLNDVFGFLPGPPTSLVQQAALTDQLLGLAADPNSLASLLSVTGQTTTGTTTSGSENCAEGQTWVGTVTVGGQPVTINQCLSADQAAQYGL